MAEITNRPILILAIDLCLLIIVYDLWGFTYFVLSLFVAAIISCYLVKKLTYFILIALFFAVTYFNVLSIQKKTDTSVKFSNEKCKIDFTVITDEAASENAKCVTVKSNSKQFKNTKFYLYYRDAHLSMGQNISGTLKLFPYDKDNKNYVKSGVFGSFWLINIDRENGYDVFYHSVAKIRDFIKSFLFDNLSFKSARTVCAIMLGDKSILDEDYLLCVRKAGVSHIMAVSGLHLSVILGFFFFIFSKLFKNPFLKFIVSLILVFFIAAVCGFTPSVLRAGFMFLIFAFAPLIGKDTDVLCVISFAVSVILAGNPMLLFNVSFQMSVLAIISVIYVSPFYIRLISEKLPKSKCITVFVSAVTVSVFANVFTMPVAVYTFKCVSLVSVAVNILISVSVTLILQLSMAGMLLSFVPFAFIPLMFVTDYLTKYVNSVIEYFGNLKYSAITVPKTYFIFPLIVSVGLIVFKVCYERRVMLNGSSGRGSNTKGHTEETA